MLGSALSAWYAFGMTAETETYVKQFRWLLDEMAGIVEGLSSRHVVWTPAPRDANSAAVIIRHVVGSTRAYVLGVACGQDVRRDRPGEFVNRTENGPAIATELQRLFSEIESALAQLGPGALDRKCMPSEALWGADVPPEVSARDAVVESIRHAGVHLGELRLTESLSRHSLGERDR